MNTDSVRTGTALASAAFMTLAGFGSAASGADWPRWLGPSQNGFASAEGALSRPSPRLRKLWTHPIGGGRSGVVIADGRLFTLVADGETQAAIALDVRDGKELWRVKIGPHDDGSLTPVSTPAVDGGKVFVVGTDCTLRALSAITGEVAFAVDLKQRFGSGPRRGCESSPFVENGRVILQPAGAGDHRLVALDARNGELVWSSKGRELAYYSSPVAAVIAGVRQVIVHHVATPSPRSGLTGFRLADGVMLWSRTFEGHTSDETPLVLPGDRVLLATWNDAKLARLKQEGEQVGAEPLWAKPVLRSRISPPVYKGDHVYGFNADDLVCVRADTGEVVWKERLYAGSLILVDDALVILSANSGVLRVAEATPKGFREKTRVEVLNRGAQAETPPSFAAGLIFVRNDEEIVAVAIEG